MCCNCCNCVWSDCTCASRRCNESCSRFSAARAPSSASSRSASRPVVSFPIPVPLAEIVPIGRGRLRLVVVVVVRAPLAIAIQVSKRSSRTPFVVVATLLLVRLAADEIQFVAVPPESQSYLSNKIVPHFVVSPLAPTLVAILAIRVNSVATTRRAAAIVVSSSWRLLRRLDRVQR